MKSSKWAVSDCDPGVHAKLLLLIVVVAVIVIICLLCTSVLLVHGVEFKLLLVVWWWWWMIVVVRTGCEYPCLVYGGNSQVRCIRSLALFVHSFVPVVWICCVCVCVCVLSLIHI